MQECQSEWALAPQLDGQIIIGQRSVQVVLCAGVEPRREGTLSSRMMEQEGAVRSQAWPRTPPWCLMPVPDCPGSPFLSSLVPT